jgi:hypothetical protein
VTVLAKEELTEAGQTKIYGLNFSNVAKSVNRFAFIL